MATSPAGNRESEDKKRRRGGFWGFIFGRGGASILALLLVGAGITHVLYPNIWANLSQYWFQDLRAAQVQKWADSSATFTVEGKDRAGRKATFDILVLNKDFVWQRGSDTQLMRGETLLSSADLDSLIFRPDVRTNLAKASEVISVGVASQEGGEASEVIRAGRRAETGAGWLRIVLGQSAKVSTLNLGQYRTGNCATPDVGDTSWQRPFMIIGMRNAEANVNLSEALADAFTAKTNLPSPECYSTFQLARAP